MKIVQIMASDGEGGLEKHFIELCNGLSEAGHEVFALCLNKYQSRLSTNIQFIDINLTGSRRNPITILRLFKTLKKIDADIIHAQANKAAQLLTPLLKHLTAKSIVTIHNIKNKLDFTRKFNLVIGVSQGVAKQLPKDTNSVVIYNGISIPTKTHDKPDNLPALGNDKPVAISIGRLVPAKGFDLLIKAASQTDCYILIAGDGPEENHLSELIKKHKLEEKVFLLGHRNDIPSLISYVDFVIISSRKEGFSYVFSESLLSSKPVISTDVPIPNEILPQRCLSGANEDDLGAMINRFINNKDSWPDIFEPIFNDAKNSLTFTNQINRTLDEYKKLVK